MIGYTLSIGFIGIEMFGFMSGITMFSPTNGFICILFYCDLICNLIKSRVFDFFFFKTLLIFSLIDFIVAMICHGVATVMMFYFLQDLWSCEMFWSVFFLCSIVPCGIELIMIIYSFIMKK